MSNKWRYCIPRAAILLALGLARVTAATTISAFTGGDPGEGLDLSGNILVAVNVGTTGAAGKAGDADFTEDTVDGVVVTAVNEIPNWHAPEYGDSEADDVLETVMRSIRWSAAPETPKVAVDRLVVGASYKLQLLFAEQCCAGRGFNVVVNGGIIAENFIPAAIQEGAGNTSQGAVITHDFLATSATLNIVLDGPGATSADISDRNAILSGFTLEQVSAPGDADGDGLADAWEQLHFSNLDQTGSGDPDADGLTNAQELTAGTNPKAADSDGDTLTDGAEVKTHLTNPLRADSDSDGLADATEVTLGTNPSAADTDGDGLSDSREVNVTGTDPKKADTDGDGFNDATEVLFGTNGANKDHFPRNTQASVFTGADAGEGLDLDGTFLYALNAGTPGAAGKARDADFTADDAAGITLTAGNNVAAWATPSFGDSADDDVLEIVMQSIRWSAAGSATTPAVNLDLDSLVVGKRYKLQLLFSESCCAGRAFDVLVGGALLAHEFNPAVLQGRATGTPTNGAVFTYEFSAQETTLHVVLDGRGTTNPQFTDHNATLSGATLEEVNTGADTDSDGLPDAWEQSEFGNLAQTGSGDQDGDGLSNLKEFQRNTGAKDPDTDDDGLNDNAEVAAGTNANRVDSDGDGLSDGVEINDSKTNPLAADTDEDGLSDATEVNVAHTDPKKKDTDGDGIEDGNEVAAGTDPLVADAVTFEKILLDRFTGGDAGEGLDLDGNFVYAVNIGRVGAVGAIRDANFTAENTPGFRIRSGADINVFFPANLGDSENDDRLEKVMQSIRHTPPVDLTVSNLVVGATYKIQLLFGEGCCNRGFDILANGVVLADEFSTLAAQGEPDGVERGTAGGLVSAEFVAKRTALTVVLTGTTVTTPELTDRNPIINGITLELIKDSTLPVATQITAINRITGGVSITFDTLNGRKYAVDYRSSLTTGAWGEIQGNLTATGTSTTYQDTDAGRAAAGAGFYRIRSL